MFFITADEHYFHKNIIEYAERPFKDLDEMHAELIKRHNEVVVSEFDRVIHAGDFSFAGKDRTQEIITQLNGQHTFLKGSHDKWLGDNKNGNWMWIGDIKGKYVVICHYSMRTWERSHYNSWQLYGHSHGRLEPIGKQLDIGVDCNNYYPFSWDQIVELMKERSNNPNYIHRKRL